MFIVWVSLLNKILKLMVHFNHWYQLLLILHNILIGLFTLKCLGFTDYIYQFVKMYVKLNKVLNQLKIQMLVYFVILKLFLSVYFPVNIRDLFSCSRPFLRVQEILSISPLEKTWQMQLNNVFPKFTQSTSTLINNIGCICS